LQKSTPRLLRGGRQLAGAARPAPLINGSSFWAQGVKLGASYAFQNVTVLWRILRDGANAPPQDEVLMVRSAATLRVSNHGNGKRRAPRPFRTAGFAATFSPGFESCEGG
jgi:hypothetical protein